VTRVDGNLYIQWPYAKYVAHSGASVVGQSTN
jgi:hypothetical protein